MNHRKEANVSESIQTKEDQSLRLEKIMKEWDTPEQAVLPLLHYFMEEKNYISDADVARVSQMTGLTVSDILGIGTFYQHFAFHPTGKNSVRVCLTTPCLFRGGKELFRKLSETLGIGLEETTPDGLFSLYPAQCLGQCSEAPSFSINNDVYVGTSPEKIPAIIEEHRKGKVCQTVVPVGEPLANSPMVFTSLKSAESVYLEKYLAKEGYKAFEALLRSADADHALEEIKKSGLAGRGGGAFPMYRKLEGVRKNPAPRYLVCNADEGEPGTFKDRYIMERDPHSLIEGMAISAYIIGAEEGFIYIRSEYPHSYMILEKAIAEAREKGFLGHRILGSDFSFRLRLYRGAGAYICGEETSLINSLEGKRAYPRNKPPHLSEVGLWNKPTEEQNVETLANVPVILRNGGEWYARLGDEKSPGSKLFCLSGNIARPGLYEIPLGMSLRSLIEDLGGGVPGGHRLKALLPAGSASKMLLPEHLDLSLDYPSIAKVGAFLGSASVIVMDDSVCMVDLAYWIAAFSHHESCGQCTPCRDGTEDVYEVLLKVVQGEGKPEYLDLLKSIGSYMREASICGLGQTAPNVPLSSMEYFEEEWKAHLVDHVCPSGICPMKPEGTLVFPTRRSRGIVASLPQVHFSVH
uniref:NADH-quinone oxidoreductase subunit E/F n=1 Tax=Leptospirillum ferriphilum TaxID=178606 RepID=A0A7C3QVL4_9BACT